MGNKTSTENSGQDKEMTNSVSFSKLEQKESLPDLKQLASDCSALQNMVDDLAEAIEDIIFDDIEEAEQSTQAEGSNLQTLTRDIQLKIHQLHKYLELHSKSVSNRMNNNQVMALVREFVSIVNSYMNMLMKNIRKMKQVMEEKQLTGRQRSRSYNKPNKTVQQVDLIPEQLDVDSMLMQLTETEMHREELERDILDVLVIWRDFVELMHGQEESLDKVETNVKVREAADSVARGLAQLQATGK